MKFWFTLFIVWQLFAPFHSVAQELFTGTPSKDWIEVSATASVVIEKGKPVDRAALAEQARQMAIEQKLGSSISFGGAVKSFSDKLEQYDRLVELNNYFVDGVWKADISQPEFSLESASLTKERRRGTKEVEADRWCCRVHGYAAPLLCVAPAFEYQIMNGDNRVIIERISGKKGSASNQIFKQGDLFRLRFRASRGGYLALYMDNSEVAQRMLPYAAASSGDESVKISADIWHPFFDVEAVSAQERQVVDELELVTDMGLDCIRIYFIFSSTPFSKDFFFLSDVHPATCGELPEGYNRLPSVDSRSFARWLQQNRIRKPDLQIAIADIVIDNSKK